MSTFPMWTPPGPVGPAPPPGPFDAIKAKEEEARRRFLLTPQGQMSGPPAPALPAPQFPTWDAPVAPLAPPPVPSPQPTATDDYLKLLQAKPGTPDGAPVQPGTPGGPSVPWYKKIGAAALGAVGGAAAGLAAAKGRDSNATPQAIAGAQQHILQGQFPTQQAQYAQRLKQAGAAAEQEQSITKARQDAEFKQSQMKLQSAQASNESAQGELYKAQAAVAGHPTGQPVQMLDIPEDMKNYFAPGTTQMPASILGPLIERHMQILHPPEKAAPAPNLAYDSAKSWLTTHPGKTLADYQIMLKSVGSVSGVSGPPLTIPSGFDPSVDKSAVLNQLSPADRVTVQRMGTYKFPVPTGGFAMRDPKWKGLIDATMLLYPDFDVSKYAARQNVIKNYTTSAGKANQAIRSLNTAIKHLDTLSTTYEALPQSGMSLMNQGTRFMEQNLTDNSRFSKAANAANAVTNEMATVFKNTSGTDQEIKAWRGGVDPTKGPQNRQGSIDTLLTLIAGRLEVLHRDMASVLGPNESWQLLDKKTRDILVKYGIDPEVVDPGTLTMLEAGNAPKAAAQPSSSSPATGIKAPQLGTVVKWGKDASGKPVRLGGQ